MGGEVSTDFKSSNRIQVLLNFDWFQGSPLGGRGVGGWSWGMVRGCPTHTCTCMCMHACWHMHKHIWHHREFPGIPQKSNGSSHLHEIIMFTTCACACVHMHVHICGGHPNHPPPPSTHPPTPRAAGSPKHQNSISLELIEIIRFCLKIL